VIDANRNCHLERQREIFLDPKKDFSRGSS
jgi:hypothetical protein